MANPEVALISRAVDVALDRKPAVAHPFGVEGLQDQVLKDGSNNWMLLGAASLEVRVIEMARWLISRWKNPQFDGGGFDRHEVCSPMTYWTWAAMGRLLLLLRAVREGWPGDLREDLLSACRLDAWLMSMAMQNGSLAHAGMRSLPGNVLGSHAEPMALFLLKGEVPRKPKRDPSEGKRAKQALDEWRIFKALSEANLRPLLDLPVHEGGTCFEGAESLGPVAAGSGHDRRMWLGRKFLHDCGQWKHRSRFVLYRGYGEVGSYLASKGGGGNTGDLFAYRRRAGEEPEVATPFRLVDGSLPARSVRGSAIGSIEVVVDDINDRYRVSSTKWTTDEIALPPIHKRIIQIELAPSGVGAMIGGEQL